MPTDSKCEELEGLISEYALGAQAELSPGKREAVELHLAECEACRKVLAAYRRLNNGLRAAMDISQIEVPEKVLIDTKYKVMAQVRESIREREKTENRERVIHVRSFWITIGAAAAVLIALGLWQYFCSNEKQVSTRQKEQLQAPQVADSHPQELVVKQSAISQSKEATNRERFAAIGASKEALAFLQSEFEKAKAAARLSNRAFEEVMVLAKVLMVKWPETLAAVKAQKLISRCYTQMAEHEKAQEAFLAYADGASAHLKRRLICQGGQVPAAELKAVERVCQLLKTEGDRLFQEGDLLGALSYFDILMVRYPGTEAAENGRYMVGRCSEDARQYKDAALVYQEIIAANPKGKAAIYARMRLGGVLFNMGQRWQGAQVWREVAEVSGDRDIQACGYYNAGVLLSGRAENQVEAVECFRKVTGEYSDTGYARWAKMSVQRLMNETAKDMLKDLGL